MSKGSGLIMEAYGTFCLTKYITTPTVSGKNPKLINKITTILGAKIWSVQQINVNAQYNLILWCRNYFFNLSTPCIWNVNNTGTKQVSIMKQTAFW